MNNIPERIKEVRLKVLTLYWASQDPDCPLAAKLVSAAVVAYALSPLDLIPDVIPVLGYLDDLILIPAGARLAFRMVPKPILEAARQRAEATPVNPTIRAGIVLIALIWATIILICWLAWRGLAK